MHACSKKKKETRKLKKFFILKREIGMGYKKKRDKIVMGYESLYVMELLSVQCLQVDDVISILLPC